MEKYCLEHSLIFSASALISLVVYLKTLSPSIAGGDSGELVAEGCRLGTAHPPGYPLYMMLVHIITRVGPKILTILYGSYDIARFPPVLYVNAMSSFLGAATSGLISSSVYYLALNSAVPFRILFSFIAVSTGLLHSFSPLTWQYCITAEVFALHNFFVAWIVHTAIRFSIHNEKLLLYQGALISGLALANQHTSILLLIPVIASVMQWAGLYQAFILLPWRSRNEHARFARLVLGRCIVIFLVTISLFYCMMSCFAIFYPHAGSWGDIRTFSGLFQHLLRKDYGTLKLFSGDDKYSEGFLQRTKLWCIDFATVQSNLFLFLFSVYSLFTHSAVGLMNAASFNRKKISAGLMISLSLVFYLIAFHSLSNLPLKNRLFYGIHQRFWLHPNVLAFILIGDGLNRAVFNILQRAKGNQLYEKSVCVGILFTLIILDVHSLRRNFERSDQSNNTYFRNYALSILETLPQHSLLFINYDQQWTSIRYLQECEHIRGDITSINLSMMSYSWWESKRELYPNVRFPGRRYAMTKSSSTFTFSEIVTKNYRNFHGNIFIGGHLSYPDPKYSELFDEIPHGLVRRISKKLGTDPFTTNDYRDQSLLVWKRVAQIHSVGLPNLKKFPMETWEWTIHREVFDHLQSRATFLLDLTVTEDVRSQSVKLLSLLDAAFWLEISRLNDKYAASSPSLYRNLGIAYMHIVRCTVNDDRASKIFGNVTDIFEGTSNSQMTKRVYKAWFSFESPQEKTLGWKSWASTRWNESWSHYLHMDQAEKDSAYAQIHRIYHMVHNNLGRN